VPEALGRLRQSGNRAQVGRITGAPMQMSNLDGAFLQAAFDGDDIR
jgi:hypothetical protein